MDMDFEKKSDVIPVELKKDGSHSQRSSVASEEMFHRISDYVNHHIKETGEEIYQGNVEVKPFVQGQSSGCDYCPYKAVCGFDVKIPGFKERTGAKLQKEEILERMYTLSALSEHRE